MCESRGNYFYLIANSCNSIEKDVFILASTKTHDENIHQKIQFIKIQIRHKKFVAFILNHMSKKYFA